jgi:hypothetical protein
MTLELFGLLPGCNGDLKERPTPSHNGAVIPLSGGQGFFEIRTEGLDLAERGSRAKTANSSIVVYFYQSDGTTAMNPAPTDVTVKVGTGASSPSVELLPQEKPAGQFKSAHGTFPSGFRGQLSAKINGEIVETPFILR